jgi:hypothetical protein
MKRLSAFLESENNRVYKPAGFLVLNPLSNGLLYVRRYIHSFILHAVVCAVHDECGAVLISQQLQILDFRRVADRGGVTRSAENSKDV